MVKLIPYHNFMQLLKNVPDYPDFESFVSDRDIKRVFYQYSALHLCSDLDVADTLNVVWDLCHDGLSIDSILQVSGLTAWSFSSRYGFPYNTINNWRTGYSAPPKWQLPLIAYAIFSDTCQR